MSIKLLLILLVAIAVTAGADRGSAQVSSGTHDSSAWPLLKAGDTLRIDSSNAGVFRSQPLRITVPDITIALAPGLVVDGGGVDHPFIAASAEASGLIVSSIDARNPARIRGFSGGILAGDAPACEVHSLRIGPGRGPAIHLGHLARVSDVTVQRRAGNGIIVGRRGVISQAAALGNGGKGIVAGAGSSVTSSSASNNAGDGITMGRGSICRDAVAVSNAGSGVIASYSCLISDSVAELNGGDGVIMNDGSTALGVVANDNARAGISTGAGCVIDSGTARSNVAVGYAVGRATTVVNAIASNGFIGVRVLGPDVSLRGVTSSGNAYGVVADQESLAASQRIDTLITRNAVADIANADDVDGRLVR